MENSDLGVEKIHVSTYIYILKLKIEPPFKHFCYNLRNAEDKRWSLRGLLVVIDCFLPKVG